MDVVGGQVPSDPPAPGTKRPDGVPDPEVAHKETHRFFSREFKLRVLREADACTKPGDVGALLRREGLYSSLLVCWRRDPKLVGNGPPKKRKPGAKLARDPRDVENERLKLVIAKLEERLRIADLVCDAQKKVAQILGITLAKPQDDERPS